MTHYELLGVSPSSSAAEVRRAYLRLARRHHPDLNVRATPEAREASERYMQRLNEAWAVLGDAERRQTYDRSLRREAARPKPRPRRTPGAASPDFVPYDRSSEDDELDGELDPDLLDDTPIGAGTVPRWLQLLGPGLLAIAVLAGCFAIVTSFKPFLQLAAFAFILALVSFLVTPVLVVLRSSRDR